MRQALLQSFRNRLSRDNSAQAQHIVGLAQQTSELDDALNLFTSRNVRRAVQGKAAVTQGSKIIALPLDFLLDSPNNDNILKALEQNIDPNLPKPHYSTFNFQQYGLGVLNTRYPARSYNQVQEGISRPILPDIIPTCRPPINYENVNGVMTPCLIVRYYTPTATITWNIIYDAFHIVADAVLALNFTINPSNGDSLIIDGATITFVNAAPDSTHCLLGLTLSATLANLQKVLKGLTLQSSINGAILNVSTQTGGDFTFTVDQIKILGTYLSAMNTIPPQFTNHLYNLWFCQALRGRVSNDILEQKSFVDLMNFSTQLENKTLATLTKR